MRDDWRLPAYDEGRCFSALPARIERLLAEHARVALVYFDAFGWRFFERHADHPLFRDATAERWTSQFPSTTAVHSTTINTGLPLAEHGIYEWFVYEPRLNRLVTPLSFSFAGDREHESLQATGFEGEDLFPFETIYERLAVPSFTAAPGLIAYSTASRRLTAGATPVPFDEPFDGARLLAEALAGPERAYGTLYLPALDALMHLESPDSESVDPLVTATLDSVAAAPWPEGTLVLLTSDHGCTAISPDRTSYVNVLWPELGEHLERGADGKPLAPAGSPRDLFLHVRPERLDDVAARLRGLLDGKADVELVADLLAAGLFGPEPGEALRARLANLVVLPYADEAVYWLEAGRFEQKFFGQHGGLSSDEMDIPVVSWIVR